MSSVKKNAEDIAGQATQLAQLAERMDAVEALVEEHDAALSVEVSALTSDDHELISKALNLAMAALHPMVILLSLTPPPPAAGQDERAVFDANRRGLQEAISTHTTTAFDAVGKASGRLSGIDVLAQPEDDIEGVEEAGND